MAIRLPSLKTALFQTHWFLGITAGMVLMVVGVTGGLLSFQDEIMRALNPGVLTVAPRPEPRLPPAELIRRIEEGSGARVLALSLAASPGRAVRATVSPPGAAPQEGGGRPPRGEPRYADPWTGALLGAPTGDGFFRTTRELHRWLLAGQEGKVVVGVSTIALVFLSLSGLYLRWPRRALNLRTWFHISPRLRGRALNWRLHSVIGTWVLPLYVLMGLTGLFWSFDWYRNALFDLTGAPRPAQAGPPRVEASPRAETSPRVEGAPREGAGGAPRGERGPRPAPVDIDRAWAAFLRERPDYGTASLRIPSPGQPLRITYVDADPAHEDARNTIAIDAADRVVEHRRYDDQPLAHQLMGSMLALHSGRYFGNVVTVLMMIASLVMPLFGITGIILYLDRRRAKRAAAGRPRRRVAAQAAE